MKIQSVSQLITNKTNELKNFFIKLEKENSNYLMLPIISQIAYAWILHKNTSLPQKERSDIRKKFLNIDILHASALYLLLGLTAGFFHGFVLVLFLVLLISICTKLKEGATEEKWGITSTKVTTPVVKACLKSIAPSGTKLISDLLVDAYI